MATDSDCTRSGDAAPASRSARQVVPLAVLGALSLSLAAFFGFVGYMKATAPLADLARHGAWTAHIPELAGRLTGLGELACAALLLAGLVSRRWSRLAIIAAVALVCNQAVAASVHYTMGEKEHLVQNAVLGLALAAIALLHLKLPVKERK